MSGVAEEWVKAAMTDDTMVVDLLVRLHGDAPPAHLKRPTLPLEWSVRQRRSRHVFANINTKKQAQSHRASPTTPLSWSGATFSGGSGGSEESSRPHIQKPTRSKRKRVGHRPVLSLAGFAGSYHVDVDGEKPVSKRSRRKKTLAELKDEESLLLKERRELKREIAVLRMNLEKQRAKNENLKRIKIELQPLPDRKTSIAEESISDQLQPKAMLQSSSSNDSGDTNAGATSGPSFVLPDLNMPFEDDAIGGIS